MHYRVKSNSFRYQTWEFIRYAEVTGYPAIYSEELDIRYPTFFPLQIFFTLLQHHFSIFRQLEIIFQDPDPT